LFRLAGRTGPLDTDDTSSGTDSDEDAEGSDVHKMVNTNGKESGRKLSIRELFGEEVHQQKSRTHCKKYI
jgi:hypothetical protein